MLFQWNWLMAQQQARELRSVPMSVYNVYNVIMLIDCLVRNILLKRDAACDEMMDALRSTSTEAFTISSLPTYLPTRGAVFEGSAVVGRKY